MPATSIVVPALHNAFHGYGFVTMILNAWMAATSHKTYANTAAIVGDISKAQMVYLLRHPTQIDTQTMQTVFIPSISPRNFSWISQYICLICMVSTMTVMTTLWSGMADQKSLHSLANFVETTSLERSNQPRTICGWSELLWGANFSTERFNQWGKISWVWVGEYLLLNPWLIFTL